MPTWTENLRHFYWFLRYCRKHNQACRRKYYRRIEHERKRLHEEGVDQELTRLFCRWVSNPRNENAEQRFQNHAQKLKQLTLF